MGGSDKMQGERRTSCSPDPIYSSQIRFEHSTAAHYGEGCWAARRRMRTAAER